MKEKELIFRPRMLKHTQQKYIQKGGEILVIPAENGRKVENVRE